MVALLADFLLFRRRSRLQVQRTQEKQTLQERFPKHVVAGVFRTAANPSGRPALPDPPPLVNFACAEPTPCQRGGQGGSKVSPLFPPAPLPPPQARLPPVAGSPGPTGRVSRIDSTCTPVPPPSSRSDQSAIDSTCTPVPPPSSRSDQSARRKSAEGRRSSSRTAGSKQQRKEQGSATDLLPESEKDRLLNVLRKHRRKKRRNLSADTKPQGREATDTAVGPDSGPSTSDRSLMGES